MFTRCIRYAISANNKKEDDLRYNHVAIILRKGIPVSIGINREKTHPVIRRFAYGKRKSLHAELDACIKYGMKEDYSDCTMVVMRFRDNGSLASSKPCAGCRELISSVGLSKVYFTNDIGEFIEL